MMRASVGRSFEDYPNSRDDVVDLVVGHVGQPGENITEISVGIQATSAAAFDNGVEDGTPITGIGVADEEPVLLSNEPFPLTDSKEKCSC